MSESSPKYYAMIDGVQKGPFKLEEIAEAGVRPSTYVWTAGMNDWEKAEDVADICRFFRIRLFDLMHPSPSSDQIPSDGIVPVNDAPAINAPTRFDPFLDSSDSIPTLDEIDSLEDKDRPPFNVMPFAILSTVLFFPPTGIVAIYLARKSRKAWKIDNHTEAHNLCRLAKMWTGITFFLGLILISFLCKVL